MYDDMTDPAPAKGRTPPRGGIKSVTFNSKGTNGASHRKNRERKARNRKRNVLFRAQTYQQRGTMTPQAFHEAIRALQLGTC